MISDRKDSKPKVDWKKVEYPVMGCQGDKVVLFADYGLGCCVYDKRKHGHQRLELGHISDRWVMDLFELFEGEVTISS